MTLRIIFGYTSNSEVSCILFRAKVRKGTVF